MQSFFDEYFPYRAQLESGHYSQALQGGLDLLSAVQRFAPQQYQAAHKGTPFYVMGFAAFLSHDYETAAFLFDAAVSEDLRNYPGKRDTPALLFMQLNDKNPNHLARDIVAHLRERIRVLTMEYNARSGAQNLTVNDFCNHFLNQMLAAAPHRRTLTTAFLSFVAEWNYRSALMQLVDAGSREPFFMHMFKGCLLFESLLKENPTKPPTQSTLGKVINTDLLVELGITPVDVRETDFNALVQTIVANMNIHDAIEGTGKTRNTLGHNLVWLSASLNAQTYDLLLKNISVSCIHVISTLYR